MPHLMTVEIPDGVAPADLALLGAVVAHTLERRIGHAVDVTVTAADRGSRDLPDLSRPQELAADSLAAKWGRSRVQRQSDGAVIITGMLDDIEMDTVCIELDGRERWRR